MTILYSNNSYNKMIKIKPLAQFPNYLPDIVRLWSETIGKKWSTTPSIEEVELRFKTHLNEDILPLAYIAIDGNKAIGMCCLRIEDGGISRPEFFPWLGGICVEENYRKHGIGKLLIEVVKSKAHEMGFKKLYLWTFEKNIADWYTRNGWIQLPDDMIVDGKKIILMEIKI